MEYVVYIKSPIGKIEISGTDTFITSIMFYDAKKKPSPHKKQTRDCPYIIKKCIKELEEYFSGKRSSFSVLCQQDGTLFQSKIWDILPSIPYGKTVSYSYIASKIKKPKAYRATANAIGNNKINIIIPCHRVFTSSGKISGYGGDAWRKEWLLKHEQKYA